MAIYVRGFDGSFSGTATQIPSAGRIRSAVFTEDMVGPSRRRGRIDRAPAANVPPVLSVVQGQRPELRPPKPGAWDFAPQESGGSSSPIKGQVRGRTAVQAKAKTYTQQKHPLDSGPGHDHVIVRVSLPQSFGVRSPAKLSLACSSFVPSVFLTLLAFGLYLLTFFHGTFCHQYGRGL